MDTEKRIEILETIVHDLDTTMRLYNEIFKIHGDTQQLLVQRILAIEERIAKIEKENQILRHELLQLGQLN